MIVCGSVLGAGLLAWTAKIGCDSGLSSAGLMHATCGSSFARLPVLINIVQLIGWTTFELVVMRDGTVAIARQSGSWWTMLATFLWGAVLLALLSGSMVKLGRCPADAGVDVFSGAFYPQPDEQFGRQGSGLSCMASGA